MTPELLHEIFNESLKVAIPGLLAWSIKEFRDLAHAIDKLQTEVAVISEKISTHDKRLEFHSELFKQWGQHGGSA